MEFAPENMAQEAYPLLPCCPGAKLLVETYITKKELLSRSDIREELNGENGKKGLFQKIKTNAESFH